MQPTAVIQHGDADAVTDLQGSLIWAGEWVEGTGRVAEASEGVDSVVDLAEVGVQADLEAGSVDSEAAGREAAGSVENGKVRKL